MSDVSMPAAVLRAATETLSELRTSAAQGSWRQRAEALMKLGPRAAAAHLTRRVQLAVQGGESFRYFLVALSQPRVSPAAEAAAKGHTFRFATLEELELRARDEQGPLKPWDVEAHREGSRCLLQLEGDTLVGYAWVNPGPLVELRWGLHYNLPDDMAYNYNGYTAPAFRGTAFQGLRHVKLLELMHAQGKRRLLGWVDALNYRSLRGVEKSGYQPVGELVGLKRNGKTELKLNVDERAWSELVRMGARHRQAAAASKMVQ
jgi:hypothetical protein